MPLLITVSLPCTFSNTTQNVLKGRFSSVFLVLYHIISPLSRRIKNNSCFIKSSDIKALRTLAAKGRQLST